jgi:hypothetical protein
MEFSRINVTINGRFLSQPATGVQRYAYQVVSCWDKMLERGEIDSQRYQLEIVIPQGGLPKEGFRHISIRQVGRLQVIYGNKSNCLGIPAENSCSIPEILPPYLN